MSLSHARNSLLATLIGLLLLGSSLPAHAEEESRYTWGVVQDAATGNPLAGVTVTDPTTGDTAVTDEAGSFVFPHGVGSVAVTHPGYDPQTLAIGGTGVVVRRQREGSAGKTPLAASGVRVDLHRSRSIPLLSSHLTMGWRPDFLGENHIGTDGTVFGGAGLRPTAGRLDGALRLGPLMLSSQSDLFRYAMQRTDTGEGFGRWEYQGNLAISFVHQWGSWLGVAVGPAAILQQIDVIDRPAPQNRQRDYLDVSTTRWGLGGQALLAVWPWQDLPMTVDGRLGLYPGTWALSDALNLSPQGMWAMQASVGVRFFPVAGRGLDLRYLVDQWQTASYRHGSHGLALSGTMTF